MTLIPLAERFYHAGRTRPGLHPSMGSGQPAPPWAGLLLDRPGRRGKESAFYEGNEGVWRGWPDGEIPLSGSGSDVGPRGGGMAGTSTPWEGVHTVTVNGADPKSLSGTSPGEDAE